MRNNEPIYIIKFFDWVGGFYDRPDYSDKIIVLDDLHFKTFMDTFTTNNLAPYKKGFELNKTGKIQFACDYMIYIKTKMNIVEFMEDTLK